MIIDNYSNHGDPRFEAQLAAVKERLEAAKVSSRNLPQSPTGAPGGFSFGGAGARIAKPLRGGGGVTGDAPTANGGPAIPFLSNLQGGEKRSSWFFNTGR